MNTKYNKNYILELFDTLDKIPNEWRKDSIFVDGEYDSNQTKFEMLSNQCKIGTLAKSDIVGKALLAFLRIIIDKHTISTRIEDIVDMVFDCSEKESKEDYNMHMLVRFLANSEDDYTEIFDYDQKITATLMNCKDGQIHKIYIEEKAENLDLWDLNRVKDKILSLL